MLKVKLTLELDDSWDEYKNTLFTEDFLKEDFNQVICESMNGVVLTDLKVIKE